MTTPNWDKAFTHSVEIRQFRTALGRKDYRAIIDKLLEEGGSFAVCAGKLWLSEFSLSVCKDLFTPPIRKAPMSHPIDTALQNFREAKAELCAEAIKALPASLEAADIAEGRVSQSTDYEKLASQFWFYDVDADNEFTFESDDDYRYVTLAVIKDPQTHLEAAKKKAAEREAERKDRSLRLRNERIRTAKETLRLEGYDISLLVDIPTEKG